MKILRYRDEQEKIVSIVEDDYLYPGSKRNLKITDNGEGHVRVDYDIWDLLTEKHVTKFIPKERIVEIENCRIESH